MHVTNHKEHHIRCLQQNTLHNKQLLYQALSLQVTFLPKDSKVNLSHSQLLDDSITNPKIGCLSIISEIDAYLTQGDQAHNACKGDDKHEPNEFAQVGLYDVWRQVHGRLAHNAIGVRAVLGLQVCIPIHAKKKTGKSSCSLQKQVVQTLLHEQTQQDDRLISATTCIVACHEGGAGGHRIAQGKESMPSSEPSTSLTLDICCCQPVGKCS